MEAHFKASTEWQAIARVQRMGQGKTVNVHRMLAANTTEENLVNLTDKRTTQVKTYTHGSAIKNSSQMTSDPSTTALERKLIRLPEKEQKFLLWAPSRVTWNSVFPSETPLVNFLHYSTRSAADDVIKPENIEL